MDRWAALSQIESGDKDTAVGAAGEVSRYQIKPEVWRRFAAAAADWARADDALAVAKEVMRERCAEFEKTCHRLPTDFEFYVLWNAPAQIDRPSPVVAERAFRFCNLVKGQGNPSAAAASEAKPASDQVADAKSVTPQPGSAAASPVKPDPK